MKYAVIGTSWITEEFIMGAQAVEGLELFGVCSRSYSKGKAFSEKFGAPRVFIDLHDLARCSDVDAVYVASPNSLHFEQCKILLSAGKHVICEKPMAMNAAEAQEMMEAAKRNNKLLMIGFVRRHGNDCDVIRENVNSDTFGELYYAKATYLRRNGNPGGWFGDKSRSGGGPLIDLGVHVIDLVRFIFGNPKPVSVYGVTFQKLFNRPNVIGGKGYQSCSAGVQDKCDVEDLASAIIRFDNGAVLSVEAAFSLNIKHDEGNIELFGTKAGAKLSPNVEIFTELNNRMVNISFAQDTALNFDGLFQKEIDNYVDAILGRAECLAPAQDGVEMMKILDAVYESARTGHEVIL